MALVITKKTRTILLIVLAVLVVGGGGFLFWRINQEDTVAPEDSDASEKPFTECVCGGAKRDCPNGESTCTWAECTAEYCCDCFGWKRGTDCHDCSYYGRCGTLNLQTFPSTQTSWPEGETLCDPVLGGPIPANPEFPGPGQTTSWKCEGTGGAAYGQSCSASKVSDPVDPDPVRESICGAPTNLPGPIANNTTVSITLNAEVPVKVFALAFYTGGEHLCTARGVMSRAECPQGKHVIVSKTLDQATTSYTLTFDSSLLFDQDLVRPDEINNRNSFWAMTYVHREPELPVSVGEEECGWSGTLIKTTLSCGNGICEADETTESCPVDCGEAPIQGGTVPQTGVFDTVLGRVSVGVSFIFLGGLVSQYNRFNYFFNSMSQRHEFKKEVKRQRRKEEKMAKRRNKLERRFK